MPDRLVLQWSRLGDLLQTRPLLTRLATADPSARRILCADARLSAVVCRIPEVSDFWSLHLAHLTALARHASTHAPLLTAIAALARRSVSPDTLSYVLSGAPAAILLAEMLTPRRLFGFQRRNKDFFPPPLLRHVHHRRAAGEIVPLHLADIWAHLAETQCAPAWPDTLARTKKNPAGENTPRLGIICDAGDPQRAIPALWLSLVLSELSQSTSARIFLFGAAAPAENDPLAQHALRKLGQIEDLRGRTTLDELCIQLERMNAVIGPDTGSLHLAAALGVPVLGLYFHGAHAANTGPYAPRAIVIQDPAWNPESARRIAQLFARMVENESPALPSEMCVLTPRLDAHGIVYVSPRITATEWQTLIAQRDALFRSAARAGILSEAATAN